MEAVGLRNDRSLPHVQSPRLGKWRIGRDNGQEKEPKR